MASKTTQALWQTKRIPLVHPAIYSTGRGVISSTNSAPVNCAVLTVPGADDGNPQMFLTRRLGFGARTAVTGSPGTPVQDVILASKGFASNGYFSIWGKSSSTVHLVKNTASHATFALGGGATLLDASRITECLSGTTPALLFHVSTTGGTRKLFFPEGGAITEITDADLPSLQITGNFVYMNGYAFIMTKNGRIYNSDLNSLSSWSGSFINAGLQNDLGVGLARYKDTIVAFSQNSIEFFRITDNPSGTPLVSIPSYGIANMGCASGTDSSTNWQSGHTYFEDTDTVYWISTRASMGPAIYHLDGFKATRLSDAFFEVNLRPVTSLINSSDPDPYRLEITGLIMYNNEPVLLIRSFSTGAWETWAYFFKSKFFSKWMFANNINSDEIIASISPIYSIIKTSINYGIVTMPTTLAGTVDDYYDNGSVVELRLPLPDVDFGTQNRKRCRKLKLIGVNGDGASQAATTTTNISWSDDGGVSFNTARTIDRFSSTRAYLSNCGTFRNRMFLIVDSSATPFEYSHLELDLILGSN